MFIVFRVTLVISTLLRLNILPDAMRRPIFRLMGIYMIICCLQTQSILVHNCILYFVNIFVINSFKKECTLHCGSSSNILANWQCVFSRLTWYGPLNGQRVGIAFLFAIFERNVRNQENLEPCISENITHFTMYIETYNPCNTEIKIRIRLQIASLKVQRPEIKANVVQEYLKKYLQGTS